MKKKKKAKLKGTEEVSFIIDLRNYIPRQSSGAPNVNFQKISVRKTILDLEFSEHLL